MPYADRSAARGLGVCSGRVSGTRALALLVLLLLSGCGALREDWVQMPRELTDKDAEAVKKAAATGKGGEENLVVASPRAPARPAGPEVPAPVGAEVLRDFDNALQLLRDGKPGPAQTALEALVAAHPELGGPHANLGMVYRQAGKPEAAIIELEAAVKCNPQQPVYWNQLGIAYREQGQFAKAREAYEQATKIDPAYPAPYLNLGVLFDLYLWDSKRALELYDRYLSLTPGGDETVKKWLADLKNRTRERGSSAPMEQK